MYTSPFSETLAALSADAIARLQKGEPLDKVAAELYAKLAEVEGTLVLKAGDAALYQDIAMAVADRVVACVDKIEKIEQERSARAKPAHGSAQGEANVDASWVPRSPVGRAAMALQDAHTALRKADTDEARAVAEAALGQARQDYDRAMVEDMAQDAQRMVLARMQTALVEEIVRQRMHDGPPDRIAKLEQKLRETLHEAAELGPSYGFALGLTPGVIAAGG